MILVEPAGPLNVGSVARLCANFLIPELRLVAPRCDHLGDDALQMAVHGKALLQEAKIYPDLLSASGTSSATGGRDPICPGLRRK